MPLLPLNIDMQGRNALVVGGGQVAVRKIRGLLAAGAGVMVVASRAQHEIEEMHAAGAVSLRTGAYRTDDLEGMFLVVAATDNGDVNARVAADARAKGILVSVADAPELGTCSFPAVLRRGDLEIAVSTGGACPSFAVHVRDIIATAIGDEYGGALERLAAERQKLLAEENSSSCNARIIRSSVQREIAMLSDIKVKT